MKYVSIKTPGKAEWFDSQPVLVGQTVLTESSDPVDTGLVDVHGVKLYRVADKNPVGFVK